MAVIVPGLMKTTIPQIQEAQQIPSTENNTKAHLKQTA